MGVFQSCVANESVCASHLGKCGNEGETLVCHVQAFMQGMLPRIVFLEIAGMKANDMMPFSKIAVCRHQAGCMLCAFLCLCGYTVYLALHAMAKLHANTKHA